MTDETQKMREEIAAEIGLDAQEDPPVTQTQAEETPPAKDVDEWEGVNPIIRKKYEELLQTAEQLKTAEYRLKQAESRIGAITNELHAKKKAPTEQQMAEAAESDKAWESLKADFPDWALAVDGRLQKVISAKVEELRGNGQAGDLNELKSTLTEGTALEIQRGILGFMKPDWKTTLATKEYQDWIQKQPEDIVKLTRSPMAVDALTVLDAFEGEKQRKSASDIMQERRQRMKAATVPQGQKARPVKSEADMPPDELRRALAAEIFG